MNYEEKNINVGEYYNEMDASIFKITAPIGRLSFLFSSIFLFIFGGVCFASLAIKNVAPLVPIILIISTLWVSTTLLSQRFWDITGNIRLGILISIFLNLISIALPFVYIIVWITALFMPSETLK